MFLVFALPSASFLLSFSLWDTKIGKFHEIFVNGVQETRDESENSV